MWGASYLFMRHAVPHLGPVLMIEIRVLVAGLILLAVPRAPRGAQVGWRQHWRAYLFVGAIGIALPFVLIAEALTTIDASTAAILNALAPSSPPWSPRSGSATRSRPRRSRASCCASRAPRCWSDGRRRR